MQSIAESYHCWKFVFHCIYAKVTHTLLLKMSTQYRMTSHHASTNEVMRYLQPIDIQISCCGQLSAIDVVNSPPPLLSVVDTPTVSVRSIWLRDLPRCRSLPSFDRKQILHHKNVSASFCCLTLPPASTV